MKALKNLSKDESIYISKPDKGNGVVILDKRFYVEKMNSLLNTSKFKEVKEGKSDVFNSKEDQVNRKLLQLKKSGLLSEGIYEQLRSCGSNPLGFTVFRRSTKTV